MATAKKSIKKKPVIKKKVAVKKKIAAKKKAAPKKAAKAAVMPAGPLVIELCAPGKRCKQKPDGSFIRQNFIGGKWVQIGGTTFPTLQACKNACGG